MVVECMRSSEKRAPERPLQKRGRGNPNMQFQKAGYSINPGGRRKHTKGAKERMGDVTLEVVEFWIATMRDQGEEMSHRLRCSENIAWGFLGKPSQQVFAAHAHVDVNDLPKDGPELDRLAAMYAAMLGAIDDPGTMIDVTPSRMSALAAPQHDDVDPETHRQRLRRMTDELRQIAEGEKVEQEAERASRSQSEPRRERVRRPRR